MAIKIPIVKKRTTKFKYELAEYREGRLILTYQ